MKINNKTNMIIRKNQGTDAGFVTDNDVLERSDKII